MGKICYRVNCECLYPGYHSEFDSSEEAEEHIRTEHPHIPMMLVVPVDRHECNHPRHKKG